MLVRLGVRGAPLRFVGLRVLRTLSSPSAAAAAPLWTTQQRGVASLSAARPVRRTAAFASSSALPQRRVGASPFAHCIGPRRSMFIQTQNTPNPRSVKFLPGRVVLEKGGTRDYPSRASASVSAAPLAHKLFGIEGVTGVMLGGDYISISIAEGASWLIVKPNVFAAVMDFFAAGEPVVRDDATAAAAAGSATAAGAAADSEVVSLIKELIETRIRPSVQDDGGDITFRGFENGIVKLQLQGSCVGCPSSSVTLKNGIENMLMHYVPEVEGVEEWKDTVLENVSDQQLSKLEARLKQTPAQSTASTTPVTATA